MKAFEKGRDKTGGRVKGSRNRLSQAFVEALAGEFEVYGAEAIKVARVERPHEFLKIIASIMPKEFEITDSRLKDIPDDELDAIIELAQRRIASNLDSRPGISASGKAETIN